MRSKTQRVFGKTVAEFFAGIGLVRLGLEGEDWRTVFANDIDPDKAQMYLANFPDAPQHFVPGDIHKLPVSRVPSVTLATASFPCNDLSVAGKRVGLRGKGSSAFWGFIQILESMKRERRQPPIVMLENVKGFLTSHGGKDFAKALLALNRLGYAVDAFMLNAVRFVPQSRERLFVVGVLGQRSRKPPRIADKVLSTVRPKPLSDFIVSHRSVRWRLRQLPEPPMRQNNLEDILDDLPPGAPEWWSHQRAAYLLNQMSTRHCTIADRMITGDGWSYGTVFRRIRKHKSMAELRTDGIAGCLRTPRGGSGRQILFKAGRGKYYARLLTPTECARLMGADNFILNGSVNQALFAFGDAVCVPVIRWLAQHHLNPVFEEINTSNDSFTTLQQLPGEYGINNQESPKPLAGVV